ncbi:MAG: hypothetical protein PHO46_02475 [Thermoguttaceae bacterium]|nr:hypothetical protein [Thermoguttaceae bacterium]
MSQPNNNNNNSNEHWGSRIGVVVAVAGGAIGLGNFLRFPGQVANYGGGAFMIPYMLSFLIIAIPLASAEWALGRCGGKLGYHSPFGVYYAVSNKSRFWGLCGGLTSLTPLVIGMYYIFVEAWCLLYALQYLGGLLEHCGLGFSLLKEVQPGLDLAGSEEYGALFASFTGMTGDGSLFKDAVSPLLLVTFICAAANFYLVYRGITKGIERFNLIVAPLILLCSFIVIIRVLTLGNPTGTPGQGLLDGLGFMWNPTREVVTASGEVVKIGVLESLSNPEVWLAATAQLFFTVSICLGATLTYATYVRPKEDIALSSVTATAANEFCEVVLGGMMAIPPAIMFLGAQAADKFGSTFSLGFIVLPNVFGQMPAGQFFGFLFFLLLFFAAITSSISIIQPTIALFKDTLQLRRTISVLLVSLIILSGTTFVCWFTKDLAALDAFDFWFANFAPFLTGIIQTILIVHVWKLTNLRKELDCGAIVKLPRFIGPLLKYVSLPYLVLIFAFWCYKNLKGRIIDVANNVVAQYSLLYIAGLALGLLALTLIALRRWRKEEEQTDLEECGGTKVNS